MADIEERRIDGQYGEVWHAGEHAGDIMELTGRIAVERREIPVAGRDRTIFRRGRVSREGSIRVGKVDSRFEDLIIGYASLTPDQRRDARNAGVELFPETTLTVKIDDPDSWGGEELQLHGVKFWEIAIGFTLGDLLERELPFTWETEQLLKGVPRPGNRGAYNPVTKGYTPWGPPSGAKTWEGVKTPHPYDT